MSSTIYIVSGANRGIGYGFVSQILTKHDSAFVYAGARDPHRATALIELKEKFPDRLEIVKLVSSDVEGNSAAAKEIEARHGRVDTVIANAGIGTNAGNVAMIKPEILQEHFSVNVTGTVVLFQAMFNLLKKSPHPRFVPVSSAMGCLDGRGIKLPFGGGAYGSSKAALNWVTRKIHFENEWLVAFPLSPGPVYTDMLRNSMNTDEMGSFKNMIGGIDNIPKAADVSALALDLIDKSTREKDGGKFVHIDGTYLQW